MPLSSTSPPLFLSTSSPVAHIRVPADTRRYHVTVEMRGREMNKICTRMSSLDWQWQGRERRANVSHCFFKRGEGRGLQFFKISPKHPARDKAQLCTRMLSKFGAKLPRTKTFLLFHQLRNISCKLWSVLKYSTSDIMTFSRIL